MTPARRIRRRYLFPHRVSANNFPLAPGQRRSFICRSHPISGFRFDGAARSGAASEGRHAISPPQRAAASASDLDYPVSRASV